MAARRAKMLAVVGVNRVDGMGFRVYGVSSNREFPGDAFAVLEWSRRICRLCHDGDGGGGKGMWRAEDGNFWRVKGGAWSA